MKADNWSPGTAAHLSIETSIPSARRRSANFRTHSRWASSSQEYEMNADLMTLSVSGFRTATKSTASLVLPASGWVTEPGADALLWGRASDIGMDLCRRTLPLHI